MKKRLLTALITFCMCWSTSLWADERRVIEKADFKHETFEEKADFSDAIFKPKATLWKKDILHLIFKDTIYAKTSFAFTYFSEIADFRDVQFSETADFWNAKFSEKAYFFNAQFSEKADFIGTQFSEKADFSNAKFSEKADFNGAQFSETADFSFAKLPDTLIFHNTKAAKEIDLSNTILDSAKAAQGHKCKIDLRNASIENFHLTYDNFQILKPNYVPSKRHFQELNVVYQKLLKNFKERGYTSSYESLDKEYKAFLFTQNPYHGTFTHGLNVVLNGVNKLWYDYGYAKWYIFVYIIGFLVVFSLINWFLFPHLLKAYNIKSITKHLPYQYINRKNMFTRKVFKLSFFYTCLVFFGLKMDTSALNFDKGKAVLYLFFVYAAGLFCLAYLTNFIISSNLIGG